MFVCPECSLVTLSEKHTQPLSAAVTSAGQTKMSRALAFGWFAVRLFLLGSGAASNLSRSDATPSAGLIVEPLLLLESAALRVTTARNIWEKGFFSPMFKYTQIIHG